MILIKIVVWCLGIVILLLMTIIATVTNIIAQPINWLGTKLLQLCTQTVLHVGKMIAWCYGRDT